MSDDQAMARYLAEMAQQSVPAPALQLTWARTIDAAQQAFNQAVLACVAACGHCASLMAVPPDAGALPRWLARRLGAEPAVGETFSVDANWTPEQSRAQLSRVLPSLRLRSEFMAEVCNAVRTEPSQDATTRAFLGTAQQAQARIRVATDRLVRANQRLVVNLARQYRHAPLAFMDLVQEGNLGLLRAIERFDPEHGARVSTYALWWVRRAMVYAIARQSHAVRPPLQQYWAARQMQRALNRLEAVPGCRSKLRATAREFGVSVADVQDSLALLIPATALHATPDGDDGVSRIDRLVDNGAADPEGRAMERDLHRAVAALLDRLPQRQAKILRMRFGIDVYDDCTLEQIAQQQGVTRERIRQIEAQALEALRTLDAAWLLRGCVG